MQITLCFLASEVSSSDGIHSHKKMEQPLMVDVPSAINFVGSGRDEAYKFTNQPTGAIVALSAGKWTPFHIIYSILIINRDEIFISAIIRMFNCVAGLRISKSLFVNKMKKKTKNKSKTEMVALKILHNKSSSEGIQDKKI